MFLASKWQCLSKRILRELQNHLLFKSSLALGGMAGLQRRFVIIQYAHIHKRPPCSPPIQEHVGLWDMCVSRCYCMACITSRLRSETESSNPEAAIYPSFRWLSHVNGLRRSLSQNLTQSSMLHAQSSRKTYHGHTIWQLTCR